MQIRVESQNYNSQLKKHFKLHFLDGWKNRCFSALKFIEGKFVLFTIHSLFCTIKSKRIIMETIFLSGARAAGVFSGGIKALNTQTKTRVCL
jgi:hypothetical protein